MCSKPIKAQIDFRKELTKYMYHLNFFKIYIIRPISNQLSNNLILPGLKKRTIDLYDFQPIAHYSLQVHKFENVHSYRFFFKNEENTNYRFSIYKVYTI